MLELTHVHVLFRNSHLANEFNFNVNEPVRVEVEVYVDFATSLLYYNFLYAIRGLGVIVNMSISAQNCKDIAEGINFYLTTIEFAFISFYLDHKTNVESIFLNITL